MKAQAKFGNKVLTATRWPMLGQILLTAAHSLIHITYNMWILFGVSLMRAG